MTEKERYETLIDSLIETIRAKNGEIDLKNWQIEKLEKALAEAEAKIPESEITRKEEEE